LIVGLSTEEFNAKKNKTSVHNWSERKYLLDALRYVDLVIPENSWEQKITDIQLYEVAVFTIGSDWEGQFDFLSEHCQVVYLPRTPDISSTAIRNSMRGLQS
jgi:glycerol-3-phosphate cytidylyltransferase